MAPAGAEPTIEREHVLRCNASSYHWQLAAQSLPSHSRHVSSVSRWLLSHTVIPVTLATAADGAAQAEYRYDGGSASFDNVFLPPEFDPDASPVWALHLGAVLGPLSASEAALVSQFNEANPQLVVHRGRVARIDYADFEFLGDYRSSAARATRRSSVARPAGTLARAGVTRASPECPLALPRGCGR